MFCTLQLHKNIRDEIITTMKLTQYKIIMSLVLLLISISTHGQTITMAELIYSIDLPTDKMVAYFKAKDFKNSTSSSGSRLLLEKKGNKQYESISINYSFENCVTYTTSDAVYFTELLFAYPESKYTIRKQGGDIYLYNNTNNISIGMSSTIQANTTYYVIFVGHPKN